MDKIESETMFKMPAICLSACPKPVMPLAYCCDCFQMVHVAPLGLETLLQLWCHSYAIIR